MQINNYGSRVGKCQEYSNERWMFKEIFLITIENILSYFFYGSCHFV